MADSLNSLAGMCDSQDRYSEAAPLYQQALGMEHFDTKALMQQMDNVQAVLNDATQNHLLE